MRLYHGTDIDTARKLASDPKLLNVSLGGGELGQGFYVTDNASMAIARAQGAGYPRGGAIIEIEVDLSAYATLAILTLNLHKVRTMWRELRRLKQTDTYKFGFDVIHGPLATYSHVNQFKFESVRAEAVLKQSVWTAI